MDYQLLQDTHATSWRKSYNFLFLFYINVFFSCVSFSIVMPSLWPYIERHNGSEYLFALALFIYSLGELLGALIFGYMHNYCKTTICLKLCMSLGLSGSVLYFIADYFGGGDFALALICIARFLQGLWTGGQQAIEAAYVSEVVADEYKSKVLAELGMAAVLGFIMGPCFGIGLSFMGL